jgi:hypothetical protein
MAHAHQLSDPWQLPDDSSAKRHPPSFLCLSQESSHGASAP